MYGNNPYMKKEGSNYNPQYNPTKTGGVFDHMFHVAIYMYNTPPGPTDIAGWETTSQNGGCSTIFLSIPLMWIFHGSVKYPI